MVAMALLAAAAVAAKPNFVFIMADDVGYGDLSSYGAVRVQTPNLDRLASEGMRFTNGHSTASTCSPSRYSMLTGVYAWRPPALSNGILSPTSKMSVQDGQTTVASFLKEAGYKTAVVGKWHLGLGAGSLDYNKEIKPSPNDIGFDYSFIIPSTNDRVPCVYVENRRVVGLDPADPIILNVQGNEPTGKTNPEMLVYPSDGDGHAGTIVDSISRMGFMNGGKKARWRDEEMADTLVDRAVRFIEANRASPFFLYFASQDVHVPRYPHPRFRGRSQCGIRCDALVQLDWAAGAIVAALDRLGLRDSTVVIFSSDNGGVIMDGYLDGSAAAAGGHLPNGPLRGNKYAIYEGGHRVPFIVRWPGKVAAGSVSDQLVCQVDMLATAAAILGRPLPAGKPFDSRSLLPTWNSGGKGASRENLVVSENNAAKLAILSGEWKYISNGEVYNLRADPGEKTNVAAQNPAQAAALKAALDKEKAGAPVGLGASGRRAERPAGPAFCAPVPGARSIRLLPGSGFGSGHSNSKVTVFRDPSGRAVYGGGGWEGELLLPGAGVYSVVMERDGELRRQRVVVE